MMEPEGGPRNSVINKAIVLSLGSEYRLDRGFGSYEYQDKLELSGYSGTENEPHYLISLTEPVGGHDDITRQVQDYDKKREAILEGVKRDQFLCGDKLGDIIKSLLWKSPRFKSKSLCPLNAHHQGGRYHFATICLNKCESDLDTILNKSTQGVVYMSFGSNVHSSELPLEKKQAFLNVFRRLQYTVLWKWEEESLEGKPDNLIIRKWLPQKEILAHPNVKVFISHGGLIGTQEAIFHGVPIIGVPIYADQYNNLLQAQEAGMGRILQYHDITEENLETALRTILENETYRIRAKEMSSRFQDRPFTALETAMFWIDYVIRNKGADFMKNPARNLSFVAYHMVDVYAFIISVIAVFILVIVKLAYFFVKKENVSKKKSKRG